MNDNVVQKLVEDSFGSENMWNCWSRVADLADREHINSILGDIARLAIILGFILASIQLAITVYSCIRDKKEVLSEIIPLIFKMVLISALITPPVYMVFTKYVFAAPADACAGWVTASYSNSFLDDASELFKSFSVQSEGGFNFLKSVWNGSLISTLLAAIIWVAAAICLFITPMIQSTIFLYLFLVGPVCLVFSFCDFTVSVAKAWVSLTLTVAWMGFFGRTAFLVADSMDILKIMAGEGSGWSHLFPIMIYGVIAIILFCLAFPITSYFFKATGAMGSIMSPGRAIAGTAGAVTGSMAAGAALKMGYGGLMKGNSNIRGGANAFGILEPRGRFGADAIASVAAPQTPASAGRPSVSSMGQLNSAMGSISAKGIRTVDDVKSAFPRQSQAFVENTLGQQVRTDRNIPYNAQIVPKRGEGIEDAVKRTADTINSRRNLSGEMERAMLSHVVSSQTPVPGYVRVNPEGDETFDEALLRTADDADNGLYPSQKIGVPKNVDEFRRKFPFQNKNYVDKSISPFIDEGRAIPQGAQIVSFKGESILNAKKRIGNAINAGDDLISMQNRAFVSHLTNSNVDVPGNLQVEKKQGESFAAAALRTASELNKGNSK
jgi:hypothetical protein